MQAMATTQTKTYPVCWEWYRQGRNRGRQWKEGRRLWWPGRPLISSSSLLSWWWEWWWLWLFGSELLSPAGGVQALVLAKLKGSWLKMERVNRAPADCAMCQTHAAGRRSGIIWLFSTIIFIFYFVPGWGWRWRWRLWPWNLKPPLSDLFAGEHISPESFTQWILSSVYLG